MSRFAIPFQVPSKNSLDQHVFTIKPERQIRWKKERTSKTNSGRNVRLIISIIQKLRKQSTVPTYNLRVYDYRLRKQSTVPTYNLRVYDYRLLKVLELMKIVISYKRIFFGRLSVLVSRTRDRWKLDLQFSHQSNFLFRVSIFLFAFLIMLTSSSAASAASVSSPHLRDVLATLNVTGAAPLARRDGGLGTSS